MSIAPETRGTLRVFRRWTIVMASGLKLCTTRIPSSCNAAFLFCAGQAPVTVLNAEVHANAVAPGGTTWGLVALEWPPLTNGPTVVKFAFPSDGAGDVSAVLVL